MRIVPAPLLLVLAACHGAPAPKPPTNLEELVHYCQEKAALNFTYDAETGAKLREHGFKLEGSDQRTAEGWLATLRGALGEQQLELVRIGPERMEVWLVRPVR